MMHELKIKTFGGIEVTRKSAATYVDGRYMFVLPPQENAMECVDTLPNGFVVKGHQVSADGNYDLLMSDCDFCKRKKGRHAREGAEVRIWLSAMPEACKVWWQEHGCSGGGTIVVGGDTVQGYFMECLGCPKCSSSELPKDEPT